MRKAWLLAFLILQITATEAGLSVSVGVGGLGLGISLGGGGGGFGISVGTDSGGGGGGGGGGTSVDSPDDWSGGRTGDQNPIGPSYSNLIKPYTALQAWKSAITDDPKRILDTWVGPNVCAYKGVFCVNPVGPQHDNPDPTGPVVAGIDLNFANLQGNIVKELSLLSDLSLLHLNSNRFSGSVPNTFRDLSSLNELDLSNNNLYGSFPISVLQIPNLIYLDIRFNNFSGPIPQQLFDKKLDAIFLNNNQFDGEIPSNLGKSTASVISLANNKFIGNIPFNFEYKNPNLKEILFLNNQLTGCIPEAIGLMQELEVLDVSYNSLVGPLPETMSCLVGIKVLNLGHNKLSGFLPERICSFGSLMNLTISHNFFSGFVNECYKLGSRNVDFDCSSNCIPGAYMQRPEPECSVIPEDGFNCTRIPLPQPLYCGALLENQITSPIPSP